MKINNVWKTSIAIFIVNAIENLILLLFFGVSITQQTLIGVGVFTLVLTLILKQIGVIKNE